MSGLAGGVGAKFNSVIVAPPLQGLAPVIPAKAGIQMVESKLATRNQVRIASDKSLLHLWAFRGRFDFRPLGEGRGV